MREDDVPVRLPPLHWILLDGLRCACVCECVCVRERERGRERERERVRVCELKRCAGQTATLALDPGLGFRMCG